MTDLAAFRAEWYAEVMQLAECAQTARRAADELRAQVLELQTEADRANSAALWRTTRAGQGWRNYHGLGVLASLNY